MAKIEKFKNFSQNFQRKWNDDTPTEIILPDYQSEELEKDEKEIEDELDEEITEDVDWDKIRTEESLDVEYIKHCFNDLVESSQYNEDGETGEYRWIHNGEEVGENEKDPDACVIFMNCPAYFMKFTPDGYRGNISEFIEVNNNFTKFLQKLNGAINNLKEEYPNYKIEVLYQQALLSGHEGYQKINKEYYVVDIKLK